MRLGLLADAHSNLHALQAVLESLSTKRLDRIVYLGDLVGYNAFPREVLALAREHFDEAVMGNHDREVAGSDVTIGTSAAARAAQDWTREQLDDDDLQYLRSLPNKVVQPGAYVAVHGCYLNPDHVNGYVTQTMLPANLEAIASSAEFPTVGFCGHTHSPIRAFLRHGAIDNARLQGQHDWPRGADAVLINPGSIGQPRDGDPRASYAVVDLEARTVEVHRIQYDVEAAADAVRAAGLPENLADRLLRGR